MSGAARQLPFPTTGRGTSSGLPGGGPGRENKANPGAHADTGAPGKRLFQPYQLAYLQSEQPLRLLFRRC